MKKVELSYDEVRALKLIPEFRNQLIEEDQNTDIVDEIMIVVIKQ